MISRIAVGLALLLIPACLQYSLFDKDAPTTHNIHSIEAMKQAILDHAPAGTSRERARRFLEKEGFKVELKRNSAFVADGTQHQGVDYLLCTRTDHAGADVVKINWDIAVALNKDKVGRVWINSDLQELPALAVPARE